MSLYKICYVVTIPVTIQSFFIPQLQFLADNGFDVTVVCSQDPNLRSILGDKINFHPIDIPRGISVGRMIKSIQLLTIFFKKENFDIIQYSTPNAAFCASVSAILSRNMVRNYHLMGFRFLGAKGIEKYLLKYLEKITCMFSTHIECVSQSNLNLGVKEKLFPESKATVVWNGSTGGVDLKKFDYIHKERWRKEVRYELGIDKDDVLFGFVGRITKDKGINELIEAFSKLQNDEKLLLIGPLEGVNTLNSRLWEWAKNNSNVIILDAVLDIERYFAAMDVLVLPSYREGFGNVIIEAEAMGTPVIVSEIPGPIDAILPSKTGLFCISKDSGDLYKKLKMMSSDKLCRNQMGNAARYYVRACFDSEVLCYKILVRKMELCNKIT